MKKIGLIAAFSAAMVLVGCAGMGPKQTTGAVAGGALGGLAGSQFGGGKGRLATTGVGVLLGSILGSTVGGQLDQNDERMARDSAHGALYNSPNGVPHSWRNPNTGHYGRSYAVDNGPSCRMLNSAIYDDYDRQIGTERVRYCRNQYGQWVPS